MTTKQAALALRQAARAVDRASKFRPGRPASEVCRLLGTALREIEAAQIALQAHQRAAMLILETFGEDR